MRILIADVETTGLGANDEICELAFLEIDSDMYVVNEFQSLVKPTIPISPAASACSHITDETVEDAPGITEALARFDEDYFSNVFLVAHNSAFDRRFLSKFWNIRGDYCTLRAAKSCFPTAPNHKLQTLRYYLGLDVEGAEAHRAMADVVTTYELLKSIFEDSGMTLADLLACGPRPVRISKMPFGKYYGMPLETVPEDYRGWLLTKADIDEDLRFSLMELGGKG